VELAAASLQVLALLHAGQRATLRAELTKEVSKYVDALETGLIIDRRLLSGRLQLPGEWMCFHSGTEYRELRDKLLRLPGIFQLRMLC
jgi:hypothetical protein